MGGVTSQPDGFMNLCSQHYWPTDWGGGIGLCEGLGDSVLGVPANVMKTSSPSPQPASCWTVR